MKHANHHVLAAFLFLPLMATFGCDGNSLDPFSEVKTLRVLGVRADVPYAAPGDKPRLDMLLQDGSPDALQPDGSPRDVQVLWIEGCINPPGDMYYLCNPALHAVTDLVSDEDLALRQIPPGLPMGFGSAYEATIPSDTITSRPRDPELIHPYGLAYVFFAACGGELRKLPNADPMDFPLGCFRPGTNEQLDSRDFLVGYFPIYVFDELRNQNPSIDGVIFGPGASGEPCSETAPCSSGEVCSRAGFCIGKVKRCEEDDRDDCPGIQFKPIVDDSKFEKAVMAKVSEQDAPLENVWVMYHSTAGSWKAGSQMIHDPDIGFNASYQGYWRAPSTSQEVRVWGVVRDNRGGVTWVWRDIWVD